MDILDLATIRKHLDIDEVRHDCERNFDEYSKGNSVVPPVGYLAFPDGECHIKYGYIKGDPYFVVKIAAGFYKNVAIGLKPSVGMMLICSTETGYPLAVLNDEGHLTDMRTAIAGSIAAKHLAPADIQRIGIVGAGIQARLQLECLRSITDCRRVLVWNRTVANAKALVQSLSDSNLDAHIAEDLEYLVRTCNLIVTTTPAKEPLIRADWVQAGTHITAVGADAPEKQELDEALMERADICVVDSASQCTDHGEIHTAIANGLIDASKLKELGDVIGGRTTGREAPEQISVADLTGVAVQDIAIATSVYKRWRQA